MRTITASLLAAFLLLAASATAQASLIQAPLGNSGWTVSGSTNGSVGIAVDREGIDADGKRFVAIEIIKVFRDRPDPQTQAVPPIALNFVQTGSAQTTAERIYIADEVITNLTGVRWVDFHWVIGVTDTARFNQELTNPTVDGSQTEGWHIGPFTRFNWSNNQGLGTESLSVAGGAIDNGGSFFPGSGLGNLVIDIVALDRTGLVFTLKEIPTIPEPASLLLIGAGAVMVVLKRRASKA